MKNYAIAEIGSSQYLIEPGQEVDIDKIPGKEKEKVKFERILLIKSDGKVQLGQPTIAKAYIEATIVKQFKGDKVRVATYRAKSRYRRVVGFRPQLTRVKITKIEG